MSHTQLLLCLFGISATIFIRTAEARSARRLEGEGIQGGTDVDEGQFPYQISLETYGLSLCGGSILSERFVITAAHCVIYNDGSFRKYPLKVVGGNSNLKSKDNENRVAVDVLEVYVPKEYNPKKPRWQRTTGDIAILKLNKDLDIEGNPNLDKVKLPVKYETYEGKKAIISGFGDNEIDVITNPETGRREEKDGHSFGKMRFAESDVLSHEECQKYYILLKVTKNHICAAVVQRQKDQPEGVCAGDSGGPLVYKGTQIGVLSSSPLGCREDSKPAIYTRVSNYLDFVNKVVDGEIDYSIRTTTLRIRA